MPLKPQTETHLELIKRNELKVIPFSDAVRGIGKSHALLLRAISETNLKGQMPTRKELSTSLNISEPGLRIMLEHLIAKKLVADFTSVEIIKAYHELRRNRLMVPGKIKVLLKSASLSSKQVRLSAGKSRRIRIQDALSTPRGAGHPSLHLALVNFYGSNLPLRVFGDVGKMVGLYDKGAGNRGVAKRTLAPCYVEEARSHLKKIGLR
jgi:hypothetical protein